MERKRNYSKKHYGSRGGFKKSRPEIRPGADKKLISVFDTIGVPEKKPFTPDAYQVEAVSAIKEADCLVTAPTGSGKTWIAEQALSWIFEKGGKSWYASPLKALTNSKYREFATIFGAEEVGILTGDRKENPDAPIIVGTTEILRNQLYDAMSRGEDLNTDFVILDEAHFLGDEDRGVVWEEIMIYLPPRIPLLLLSATIGNANHIASWLSSIRSKECIVVRETKRPVPLFPLFLHPSGTLYPLTENHESKSKTKLYKKVRPYAFGKKKLPSAGHGKLPPFGQILNVLRKYRLLPAIFFLKSRADCDRALELCDGNPPKSTSRLESLRLRIKTLSGKSQHISGHGQLTRLKRLAVGAHHGGQLPSWKLVIETLMTEGLLDAVFATSTVAAGVNFPARTVVFLNSDRFNGIEFLPLDPTEFHQMTGRAGRRGMDNIGFAMAIPGKFMDIALIGKLIDSKPKDVSSRIKINFSMVLNLLLSHKPKQVEDLLKRSFATYLIKAGRKGHDIPKDIDRKLWADFLKHLSFLEETGYVTETGSLTEDGLWASQLRVDQPLMIAEGFRLGLFPESDPMLLAAVMASFVNEDETNDRISKDLLSGGLASSYLKIKGGLKDFAMLTFERGFEIRPLFLRPAAAVYSWAAGNEWKKALSISETSEGYFAMLILRTADNLRHIRSLKEFFPEAAKTAAKAIDLILRDPVATFYEL